MIMDVAIYLLIYKPRFLATEMELVVNQFQLEKTSVCSVQVIFELCCSGSSEACEIEPKNVIMDQISLIFNLIFELVCSKTSVTNE